MVQHLRTEASFLHKVPVVNAFSFLFSFLQELNNLEPRACHHVKSITRIILLLIVIMWFK